MLNAALRAANVARSGLADVALGAACQDRSARTGRLDVGGIRHRRADAAGAAGSYVGIASGEIGIVERAGTREYQICVADPSGSLQASGAHQICFELADVDGTDPNAA